MPFRYNIEKLQTCNLKNKSFTKSLLMVACIFIVDFMITVFFQFILWHIFYYIVCIESNGQMTVKDTFARMSKETIMAERPTPKSVWKNWRKSRPGWPVSRPRITNLGPSEYETHMVTTESWCSDSLKVCNINVHSLC